MNTPVQTAVDFYSRMDTTLYENLDSIMGRVNFIGLVNDYMKYLREEPAEATEQKLDDLGEKRVAEMFLRMINDSDLAWRLGRQVTPEFKSRTDPPRPVPKLLKFVLDGVLELREKDDKLHIKIDENQLYEEELHWQRVEAVLKSMTINLAGGTQKAKDALETLQEAERVAGLPIRGVAKDRDN